MGSLAGDRQSRCMKGNPPDNSSWAEKYASVVVMLSVAFGSIGYFAWNIYA